MVAIQKPVTCYDCEYNDRGYPCRAADGSLSIQQLAAGYAVVCQERKGQIPSADFWAFQCMEDLVSAAPELAFSCIRATLELLTTPHQISVLAAGPLENLVKEHGVQMLPAIEAAAKDDPRFRKLLSGIWGEKNVDPEVWRRIQAAVNAGPWLDTDSRTPQGSLLAKKAGQARKRSGKRR